MQTVKTRGLVVRKSDYGESNSMLTILTDELGVVSACAYGVRSKKSKIRSAVQPLCCTGFVLSKKGGEIYRVDSAEIIESFYPICEDVEKLALANYLCEAGREAYADGDVRILKLILNTLYVLAYKDIPVRVAKAVFELKLMQLSGYSPEMHSCIVCGEKENLTAFDFSGGAVCEKCRTTAMLNITSEVLQACRYILSAEDKKIFSFTIHENGEKNIADLAEGYFMHKSERHYRSLEYYKKILY